MQFIVSLNTIKGYCVVDEAKGFHQEVIYNQQAQFNFLYICPGLV